jgi:hypothetical protein
MPIAVTGFTTIEAEPHHLINLISSPDNAQAAMDADAECVVSKLK